ncbi:MAG: hypothetical protein HRT61_15110 [Ekhidna sp.]|nr:hypothetical protein [Ekhidna sp.]
MRDFENRLKGGHPNSLGNTLEIVDEVLAENTHFDELFHCYFSEDEIVRLRVSNSVKRICIAKKEVVLPYLEKLLHEISKIDQASTQWTLAILYKLLEKDMSDEQLREAKNQLKHNLKNHKDWIVLNNCIDTLGKWAKKDEELKQWLTEPLTNLTQDSRKSVAKRATKTLASFV